MLHKPAARAILDLLVGQGGSLDVGSLDSHFLESLAASAQGQPGPDLGRKRALQDLLDRTRQRGIQQRIAASAKPEPASAPEPTFALGDQVDCALYGRGVVVSSRLEGRRQILTVRFVHRSLVREVDGSRCTLLKKRE